MINKHKSNKIKENSNTVRHLNNGTDHRHSKSCCDQSSPARRTKIEVIYVQSDSFLVDKSMHCVENEEIWSGNQRLIRHNEDTNYNFPPRFRIVKNILFMEVHHSDKIGTWMVNRWYNYMYLVWGPAAVLRAHLQQLKENECVICVPDYVYTTR